MSKGKFSANSILLMHAQTAAFGGGHMSAEPEAIRGADSIPQQRVYREHYEQQGELYEGKTTWSQAAVGFFGSDHLGDSADHQARAHAAYDVLLRMHVATDILTPGVCTIERLSRYKLVVLPDLRFLTDEHLDALRTFHARGRRLLVFGDLSDCDERTRAQSEHPLAALSHGPLDPKIIEKTVAGMAASLRPTVEVEREAGPATGGAVKAAAWADDPRTPSQVIVHLVNFNLDPDAERYEVARVSSATVTVPFPVEDAGCRIIRVDDETEETGDAMVDDGYATAAVDDLGIHTIVVFDGDGVAPDTIR